jgi:hypothetical protein
LPVGRSWPGLPGEAASRLRVAATRAVGLRSLRSHVLLNFLTTWLSATELAAVPWGWGVGGGGGGVSVRR